jgi:hypothetical protein
MKNYYNTENYECIDVLEEVMSAEEFKGFLKGNIFKYLWRAGKKGKALEDCKKALEYMNMLVAKLDVEELLEEE